MAESVSAPMRPSLPSHPGGLPVYELPFLGRTPETASIVTYRFSTAGTDFRYRSNQAIRLQLPEVTDPRGPARSFSLSSSPSETGEIAVTFRVGVSPFKSRLASLTPGEQVRVVGPLGEFFYDPDRPAVFLAGGVGITPFRGMMRFATDQGAQSPIRTLYSARSPEDFAFRREFEALQLRHPNLQVRYTLTRPDGHESDWTGRTGRIDEDWVRDALRGLDRPKVYMAGAPGMVEDSLEMLRSRLMFSDDDLEWEFFRGYPFS